jgi:hypothetical protein
VQADSVVQVGTASGAIGGCSLALPAADVAAWDAAAPRAAPTASAVPTHAPSAPLRWRTQDLAPSRAAGPAQPHVGAVAALALSAPARLMSAGADGRVQLWAVRGTRAGVSEARSGDGGEALLLLEPFSAAATCLACCPGHADAFLVCGLNSFGPHVCAY